VERRERHTRQPVITTTFNGSRALTTPTGRNGKNSSTPRTTYQGSP
jgi:hypothetical protein